MLKVFKDLMRNRMFKHFHSIENNTRCSECGREFHDYFVPDKVWREVVKEDKLFCYDCFCDKLDNKKWHDISWRMKLSLKDTGQGMETLIVNGSGLFKTYLDLMLINFRKDGKTKEDLIEFLRVNPLVFEKWFEGSEQPSFQIRHFVSLILEVIEELKWLKWDYKRVIEIVSNGYREIKLINKRKY